jgi:DNA-directed RNA polymerase beta subunit
MAETSESVPVPSPPVPVYHSVRDSRLHIPTTVQQVTASFYDLKLHLNVHCRSFNETQVGDKIANTVADKSTIGRLDEAPPKDQFGLEPTLMKSPHSMPTRYATAMMHNMVEASTASQCPSRRMASTGRGTRQAEAIASDVRLETHRALPYTVEQLEQLVVQGNAQYMVGAYRVSKLVARRALRAVDKRDDHSTLSIGAIAASITHLARQWSNRETYRTSLSVQVQRLCPSRGVAGVELQKVPASWSRVSGWDRYGLGSVRMPTYTSSLSPTGYVWEASECVAWNLLWLEHMYDQLTSMWADEVFFTTVEVTDMHTIASPDTVLAAKRQRAEALSAACLEQLLSLASTYQHQWRLSEGQKWQATLVPPALFVLGCIEAPEPALVHKVRTLSLRQQELLKAIEDARLQDADAEKAAREAFLSFLDTPALTARELASIRGEEMALHRVMTHAQTGEELEAPVFVGVQYVLILPKMASNNCKLGSDAIDINTHQALKRTGVFGNSRVGSMEYTCVFQFGASNLQQELVVSASDGFAVTVCRNCNQVAQFNFEARTVHCSRCSAQQQERGFVSILLPYTINRMRHLLRACNIHLEFHIDPRNYLQWDERLQRWVRKGRDVPTHTTMLA